MSVGNFTGKFESSNVSRDNVSWEIGRSNVGDLEFDETVRLCLSRAYQQVGARDAFFRV